MYRGILANPPIKCALKSRKDMQMRPAAVLITSLFITLCCSPVWCADVGPVSISVPQGFVGPLGGQKDGAVTAAWVKHHPDSDGGTLLQVTTYDEGSALRGITPGQRAEGAKKYLMDFVTGVARRRENFKLGAVEALALAGLPAARVRWTGTIGTVSSIGVMYCVLVDSTVVSFHTQDTGLEITDAMMSAMAAIESTRSLAPAAH
jgi:hypothetical protein